MIAILSDIHGNLEALDAVLNDARSIGASSIYCLGDLIGYGPNPCECLEAAMDWQVVLRGNFEDAIVQPERFRDWAPPLSQMMLRLHRRIQSHANATRIWDFLSKCVTTHSKNENMYVHASPRDPINEYVFPERIYDHRSLDDIFARFDSICFCGHTHVPGIFHKGDGEWTFLSPSEFGFQFETSSHKLLCNVGSVGQPRDEDPRACYVLFDGKTIKYRRVDYDIQTTIDKIRSGDDDDMHGERLPVGR